jgi:hypothetical protein
VQRPHGGHKAQPGILRQRGTPGTQVGSGLYYFLLPEKMTRKYCFFKIKYSMFR